MRLENWAVVSHADAYTPPEMARKQLVGLVYGHHRIPDGEHVRTSDLAKVQGRTVTTVSGSVYELGTVNPDYRLWAEENGFPYNEENPIDVIKR